MARDRDDDRDDRDDDRPRRRDRDDDERPRRDRDYERPRRRDRDDDTPPKKDVSVLGVFGLIASIVALLMSFIPVLGMFAWIPGGIALLKSGVALLIAKLSQGRVGTGIPLTGTILSGVSILIAIAQVVVIVLIARNMPPPPTTSLSTPADVTISAEELEAAYDDNVAAADAKYKGKLLDVTGVVERVADDVKKFRLTVELTGNLSTVDCDFGTSEKAALASLKPGITVTIRGKCIGRRTVEGEKFVTLENCTLIPPGTKPSDTTPTSARVTTPTPTNTKPTTATPTNTKPTWVVPTGPKPGTGANAIMAADLAKAFADDKDAADTKYRGKVIEVSGQVYKSDTGPVEKWYVILGKDKKDVECRFKPNTTGVRELELKVDVTIRGKCIGLDDDRVTLEDCTLVK